MVNAKIFLLFVLIAFISTIRSAVSISCFQCNSTDINHQFLCTENMENADSLLPQPCTTLNNAAYCVTLIGVHNGGFGVKRFCSSHDLGNYCNYIKRVGDIIDYQACVYTCDSDGCNGPRKLSLLSYLKSLSIYQWFKSLSF